MKKGSSHRNDDDDDDDCCGPAARAGASTNEALFHKLAVLIKARHIQLGSYSHDEHEHLLQATQLLQMGHESQARLEVQLALQKRALHRRESLKYQNLVALRDTLQEAHRNLSLAQIMQEGADTLSIQARLRDLSKADLHALQKRVGPLSSGETESSSQPLLVSMEENHPDPLPLPLAEEVRVTEEEVATQLALLRLPPTPSATTSAAAPDVPVRREAICK